MRPILEAWTAGERVAAIAARLGLEPAVVEARLEAELAELDSAIAGTAPAG